MHHKRFYQSHHKAKAGYALTLGSAHFRVVFHYEWKIVLHQVHSLPIELKIDLEQFYEKTIFSAERLPARHIKVLKFWIGCTLVRSSTSIGIVKS